MRHQIISVHRETDHVVEVVATYGLVQITFRKDASGTVTQTKKSLASPEKTLIGLNLPKEVYAELRKQVSAIFSGHAAKTQAKTTPPNLPQPNTDKELKIAWPYHRQVLAFAASQRLTAAEAEKQLFLDSIKDPAYRLPDFPYLHPREQACFELLRQTGIKPLVQGVLGFSRTDRLADKEIKVEFKSADLNAAIRMQQHILDRYLGTVEKLAGETDRLDDLKLLAGQIHGLVLSWKELTIKGRLTPEELTEHIKNLAEEIGRNLARSRNPRKSSARSQAKHLTEPHDSLDRTNPGAQAARTAALLNRLAERLEEIASIVPFILRRKQALETKKKNVLDGLSESLDQLSVVMQSWTMKQLSPEALRLLLGQVLFSLAQASVLPYRAQGIQAEFYLKAARRHAEDRKLATSLMSSAKKILDCRPFD
ncbi:hypothetical protein HGA34_02365 [Candidatus Falkowbacteria bacterium]|nr:hypothetical protein [Candidatus Falkowbacteria bacterium]